MRILTIAVVLAVYSLCAFAQGAQNKAVYVPISQMKNRVVNRNFSNVPESVRNLHARGSFVLKVNVDESGRVSRAIVVSGFTVPANEYVQKTVSAWNFTPLIVDGKNVAFVGTLEIIFCYGAFDTTLSGLCKN